MKKSRIGSSVCLVLLFILASGLFIHHNTKASLTYIETVYYPEGNKKVITADSPETEIVQTFIMPFDRLAGLEVKIQTPAEDVNSTWLITLVKSSTQEIILQHQRGASLIADGSYAELLELDQSIDVIPGEEYEIHIRGQNVNEYTQLGFYRKKKVEETYDGGLYVNGEVVKGCLSMNIKGGEYDPWWSRFGLFISLVLLICLIPFLVKWVQGKSIWEDPLLMGIFTAGISFLLLYAFSRTGYYKFTDEMDNYRGGLIIARGGVLYRDYVTQHTPAAYYLAAIYALLGASSVAQFRLLWYLSISIFWGVMYRRHEKFFGRRVMVMLPIINILFCTVIVDKPGLMMISDNIQGLCFVALSLEFLRYRQERTLTWSRCLIVSACIWGSFGSAFVSAFALLFAGIMMIITEIRYWQMKHLTLKMAIKEGSRRYTRFIAALITPPLLAVVYLAQQGALNTAYDQMYRFNREVYSYYTGYGASLIQPFVSAVRGLFEVISTRVTEILNAGTSVMQLMQLIVICGALLLLLYQLEKKNYFDAVFLLLMLTFSATRGYLNTGAQGNGFHSLAAWHMAVLILVIYGDQLRKVMPRMTFAAQGLLMIFLSSSYVKTASSYILNTQPTVSRLESETVQIIQTELSSQPVENADGSSQSISDSMLFQDAFSNDSLYYIYKGYYPVNRTVYILPWYMDWYENWAVEDLLENMPKAAVYNEDKTAWNYTHYNAYFLAVLNQYYTRQSDDPEDWSYSLWIRKDEEERGNDL